MGAVQYNIADLNIVKLIEKVYVERENIISHILTLIKHLLQVIVLSHANKTLKVGIAQVTSTLNTLEVTTESLN